LFKLPAAAFVRPADAFPAQFQGSIFPQAITSSSSHLAPRTIMHKAVLSLLAALCVGAAPASASAADIIDNGSFEAGAAERESLGFSIGFDDWSHTGRGMARTGCAGARCLSDEGKGAFLRQVVPTVAGESYDLGFWVRSHDGKGEYAVYWDGFRIADKIIANGPMLYEAYNNLTAGSAATTLEIHGRNDASVISFDDISLVRPVLPAAATKPGSTVGMVPEPFSFMMMAAGLALVGVALRRSR
jgi:hypothetical protein